MSLDKPLRADNASIHLIEEVQAVSEPVTVLAKTGDRDGINPPWFDAADSMLLFWMVQRDEALISLRIRWDGQVDGEGKVEIWPDAGRWVRRRESWALYLCREQEY